MVGSGSCKLVRTRSLFYLIVQLKTRIRASLLRIQSGKLCGSRSAQLPQTTIILHSLSQCCDIRWAYRYILYCRQLCVTRPRRPALTRWQRTCAPCPWRSANRIITRHLHGATIRYVPHFKYRYHVLVRSLHVSRVSWLLNFSEFNKFLGRLS